MDSRRALIGGVVALLVVASGAGAVYSAQKQALRAEETFVTEQLADASCLDDWGTDVGVVTKRAAVTGIAPLGLRVNVTLPYAFRVERDGGPVFADTASKSVYEVTPFRTERLSGDDVKPC